VRWVEMGGSEVSQVRSAAVTNKAGVPRKVGDARARAQGTVIFTDDVRGDRVAQRGERRSRVRWGFRVWGASRLGEGEGVHASWWGVPSVGRVAARGRV
jgi:hypothetical protein